MVFIVKTATNTGKDAGTVNAYIVLAGMQIHLATVEISIRVPKKKQRTKKQINKS